MKDEKFPISVIILTKNEEKAITECILSVQKFSQVVIVDSSSSDRTVEIAKSLGAEVLEFLWNGDYPKKKQWALENSIINFDWVLFLDADERVSPNLQNEIRNFIDSYSDLETNACEIPLEYYFLGKRLRYGHQVRKVALINRQYCSFPILDDLHVENMWEVEGHYQPKYSGQLYRMHHCLEHQDPDGLYDYFARHNRYSDWEAELRVNDALRIQVASRRSFQGRIFDRIPLKPVVFFCYSYIIRSGWRDGRAGFHYAIALSFYYWQIYLKSRERNQIAESS